MTWLADLCLSSLDDQQRAGSQEKNHCNDQDFSFQSFLRVMPDIIYDSPNNATNEH